MKSIKIVLLMVALMMIGVLAKADEVAINAGPLASIIELLPSSIAAYVGKVLAWASGIITICTVIVSIWPSEKGNAILLKLRQLISLLSGNVGNNK